MIDNRTFGGVRVRAEGFRHQSADKKMPAFTVSAKTDTLITFIVHERRQKPRLGPFETFNAPFVADHVLVPVARHNAPCFIRQIRDIVFYRNRLLS